MSSITFFLVLVPVLGLVLLGVNFLLAPHTPYQEKNSVFECGFHSFLGQNRSQFSISFFIFGLLFLLFDLEILLIYPFGVTASINDIYGLSFMLIFFLLLTLGFVFELGKQALKIDSRQTTSNVKNIPLNSGILHKFFHRYISKLCNKNVWIRIFTIFMMGLVVRVVVSGLFNVNIFTDYLNIYSLLAYFYIAIFNVLIYINFPIDILSNKEYQLQFKSGKFFKSSIKNLNFTNPEYAKTGEDIELKTYKYIKDSSVKDSNLYNKDGVNYSNNEDHSVSNNNLGGTSNNRTSQDNIQSTSNITYSTDMPKNKKRSYLTMVELSGNDSAVTESNPRKKIKTNNPPSFAGGKNILNSEFTSENSSKGSISNMKNHQKVLTDEEKNLKLTTKNTIINTGIKKSAVDINKEQQALINISKMKFPKNRKILDGFDTSINIRRKSDAEIFEATGKLPIKTDRSFRDSEYRKKYFEMKIWYNGASAERTRDILHIANDRAKNKTLGTGEDQWNFVTDYSKDQIINNLQETTPLSIGNKLVSEAINYNHMGNPENREKLNNLYSSLTGKSFYNYYGLDPNALIKRSNSIIPMIKFKYPEGTIIKSTDTGWLYSSRYIPYVPTGILKDTATSNDYLDYLTRNIDSLLRNEKPLPKNVTSITADEKYVTVDMQSPIKNKIPFKKNVRFIDEVVYYHFSLEKHNDLNLGLTESFGASQHIEAIMCDLDDPRMKKAWVVQDGLLSLTEKIILVHNPGWTYKQTRSINEQYINKKEIEIGSFDYTEIYKKDLIRDPSICNGADLRELLQLLEYRFISVDDVTALEQFNLLSPSEQLIVLKLTSQVLENEIIKFLKTHYTEINMKHKYLKFWSDNVFLNGNLTDDEKKVVGEYGAYIGMSPGFIYDRHIFGIIKFLSSKYES